MSGSESSFDDEPNVFNWESSDDRSDSTSEVPSFDSAKSQDSEAKVIKEKAKVGHSAVCGDDQQTTGAVPLATVPCCIDCTSTSQYYEFFITDTQATEWHFCYQLEPSTSGRIEPIADNDTTLGYL